MNIIVKDQQTAKTIAVASPAFEIFYNEEHGYIVSDKPFAPLSELIDDCENGEPVIYVKETTPNAMFVAVVVAGDIKLVYNIINFSKLGYSAVTPLTGTRYHSNLKTDATCGVFLHGYSKVNFINIMQDVEYLVAAL